MSPRQKKASGRRTGVTVPAASARDPKSSSISNSNMERPEDLFNAAESPPPVGATTRSSASKKKKETVRFSIANNSLANALDEDEDTAVRSKALARKLAQGRSSMETHDLSDVSTAAASQPEQQDNDGDDFPAGDQEVEDPDHDSQDELIPPPPNSESESETEDEQVVATQQEQQRQKEEDDQEDDEDNDDGPGFAMGGGEEEVEEEDDEQSQDEQEEDPDTPESVKAQRKAEKLAAAKLKKAKKKKKAKKMAVDSSDEEMDSDDETPARKKKQTKKKKPVNRFATTFASQGIPLPTTFNPIPVSQLKQPPPTDPKLRRSKRARTTPLEYWRGEKYEYGAFDLTDQEYDGVTNMPVVQKIVKAESPKFKKRKVPAALAKKKTKKGKDGAAAAVAPEDVPFDTSKLKYNVNGGKTAQLWDERYQDTRGISEYSNAVLPLKVVSLPIAHCVFSFFSTLHY